MAIAPAPRRTDLLERDHLLARLHAAHDTAAGGRGRLVLVAGEAGVGKTSLVRRFCEELPDTNGVLWGACDALFTPRPLGPIAEVADAGGGALRAVLDGDARHHDITTALLHELRARAVLVVEDLHWADEATLDVFRRLARLIHETTALVVGTFRDDELGTAHPLRIVVGDLAAAGAADRLALAPLSFAAVTELAQPYGVDAEELFGRTGGNPFFVTEALQARDGQLPATVRDAVLARAARLSPSARRLLDLVAVAHPQTEAWLVEAEASLADLDECLGSGMLDSSSDAVSFRHELARLAVEESIPPGRAVALHRRALAALRSPPYGTPDLARLAHHAEGARDPEAVLRFAREAGDQAAALGAHREAAEQYARALRYGSRLPPFELAALLQRRSRECYLSDQADAAIDAQRSAVECYRQAGDRLSEGEALSELADILWCPGRGEEARRTAQEAVILLEGLTRGPELVRAYATSAFLCRTAADGDGARSWDRRAVELAHELGDGRSIARALVSAGETEAYAELEAARRTLEHAAELAREADEEGLVTIALRVLAAGATYARAWDLADAYVESALDRCVREGNDLLRRYVLVDRAQGLLARGRWPEASEVAAAILREPSVSTFPPTIALVVLALVRARRGDPDVQPLLERASALAEPTGELPRIAPVAAARAEAAWLRGDTDRFRSITEGPLDLARSLGERQTLGELLVWRWRGGIRDEHDGRVEGPYALTLGGEHDRAAAAWAELGCPYEAALALADANVERSLRDALEQLQRLGARPAATMVARRLRELGARRIPRGPRPSTRENTAQLTPRELDVLRLLSEGLRNAGIAERLFVSRRTVDHHVSAILHKLGVHSRGEAVAAAARSGLLEDR